MMTAALSYDDGKTWYYVGDFDEANDYNFKYFYYTFWVDKGNYLTDALKLRKTLVNIFGEEPGLNIEKEIKEQQKYN